MSGGTMNRLLNYLSQRLSIMPVEKYIFLKKVTPILVLLGGLLLYFLLAFFQVLNSIIGVLIIVPWGYLALNISRIFNNGRNMILTDQLDIIKYRQLYQKLYENTSDRKQMVKRGIEMIFIQLDVLEGKFEQAIDNLSKLDREKSIFKEQIRASVDLFYYRQLFIASLFSHSETDFENLIQKIDAIPVQRKDEGNKQVLLNETKALHDIVIKQKGNSYFDSSTGGNRLGELMIQYYRALNAQVVGDTKRATEIYTGLANQNEVFFVVREARKFLQQK